MKHVFLIIFLLGAGFKVFSQKNLVFADQIYEPQIKTVQLYPDLGGPQDNLSPSVGVLGQTNLVLEFDDLQSNRNNYYAKLIHCGYDWTRSNLMDLDFVPDYNEFPVNDYSFSGGTFQAYVHYRFQIPPVRIAGNYLLIVYRDDPSHLILSKRFMVYTPVINVIQDKQIGTSALNFSTQPLNFSVDYNGIEILNPMENIHVVIRQNQRWDNVKMDMKPTFLRDADSRLEYHFFDSDKSFAGGNEFRFVDFRSLNYPGQNTGKMNRTVKPYQLPVQTDLPRGDQAYAQYNDANGNYVIDNQDSGEPKTNANYINVTFTLNAGQTMDDPIYVVGNFNAYNHSEANRMQYVAAKSVYEATLLLKQGMYNYQYVVDSKRTPANYFEGDHFETENTYEILVYNHTYQPNADILMGYFLINLNPR